MGTSKSPNLSATFGPGRRLVTPALGLCVLVLAGCDQDGGTDDASSATEAPGSRPDAPGGQADAPSSVTGGPPDGSAEAISLAPAHGAVQGGNRVLVHARGSSGQPVTATFGDSPAVECEFDEVVRRHACVAPGRDVPGVVDVTVTADGVASTETATYTYTTPGTQDSPVLTVNLDTVRSNAEAIRNEFPSGVRLGAVLKNGEPVDVFGRVIEDAAAVDYFFVPTLDDAVALREAGITARIAVLYVAQTEDIPLLLHYRIEVAATSPAWVEEAERVLATIGGGALDVHLWVDTGLGREGVVPEEALPLAQAIEDAQHLDLAGIATHFCCVDAGDAAAIAANDESNRTVVQKNRFDAAVGQIRGAGLGADALLHAGASGVLWNDLQPLYYDMLRVGGMFFASSPPDHAVYSWTTQLEQVKTLPAGWCINYGCAEETEAPTTVGLVSHIPGRENTLTYAVGGQEVPVLLNHGTVVTLDLSDVPDAAEGDEVTIHFDAEVDYLLDATAPLPVTTTGQD